MSNYAYDKVDEEEETDEELLNEWYTDEELEEIE